MEKFTTLTGVAAPLDAANVDTDQIIPKQFLLAVDRKDFGIRAIIAPSFADIFSNNALGNGLVLVNLAEEEVDELFRILEADPGMKVTVDLVTMTCTAGERTWRFTLDPFRRKCLLEGLDAVSLTLEHEDDIRAREKREPAWLVPHVEDLKSCPV